jgi:hypothetical protein
MYVEEIILLVLDAMVFHGLIRNWTFVENVVATIKR